MLRRAVTTTTITATNVESIFAHWILSYQIPAFLLYKSCTRFGSRFFELVCKFFECQASDYNCMPLPSEWTFRKIWLDIYFAIVTYCSRPTLRLKHLSTAAIVQIQQRDRKIDLYHMHCCKDRLVPLAEWYKLIGVSVCCTCVKSRLNNLFTPILTGHKINRTTFDCLTVLETGLCDTESSNAEKPSSTSCCDDMCTVDRHINGTEYIYKRN